MKILYIDDTNAMREILSRYLKAWGYDAIGAESGEQGWELILSERPNIVITDWMMPGLDGVDLCRRIRNAGFSSYIYIILLTARNVKEDLIIGMEAGADDFIGKPFDKQELKARINAAARIISLEMGIEAKNHELEEKNRQLNEAYDVIREDLEAAARIQTSLIPQQQSAIKDFSYDWLFCPSQFIGGDIFNILQIDENHLAYYLLDVSGHGIPAALLSTTLSRLLTPSPSFFGPIRRPLQEAPYYQIALPREVAAELNERFLNDGLQTQYFTMVYGTLNLQTGTGILTQAGHPSPIHQTSAGGITLIGDGGFPIGMIPEADYDDHPLQLLPGDRLFLYSDGITECRAPDGTMFGTERLQELILGGYGLPLRALMQNIEAALKLFCGCAHFDDDVSLLALERMEDV